MNLIEALAPMVEMVVFNTLKFVFGKLLEAQPVHGAVILASMYPAIDVEVEPIVMATPTALDNAAVSGVKRAIENVAAEHNIPLSNLDAD